MYANSCLHRNMWANRFASSVAHVHSHQKRNREIFIGKLWHRRRFHAKRFFFIQYAHTHAQNFIKIPTRRCRVPAANVWTPSSKEMVVRVCSFGWRRKTFIQFACARITLPTILHILTYQSCSFVIFQMKNFSLGGSFLSFFVFFFFIV